MDSDARDREIASHYRMLKETARRPELPANRLGEEPDAKGEAGPRIVQQFNRTVRRLEELEAIPAGMFAELPDGSSWAGMSIAHEQLAAFIEPSTDRVRPDEEEEEERTSSSNPFVLNFRPNLGPEADPADVGMLAREVMPKEMRAAWKTVHTVKSDGEPEQGADRLAELAAQLASSETTPEDIGKVAAELQKLAGRRRQVTLHVETDVCESDDVDANGDEKD